MFKEEIYVNYFIRIICFFCILQSIYTIYHKNTDSYINDIKYMKETFTNGDDHKEECNINKNEFKIKEIKNFISDEECDYIIDIGMPRLRRSLTTGNDPKTKSRTSKFKFFWKPYNNIILEELSKKIEEMTGYPQSHQEEFQLLKYDIGNYYLPHYDECKETDTVCKEQQKDFGLRVMTVFIYLNNIESGGETKFPNLGKAIKPLKGKAIMWKNIRYNAIDPCALHSGEPPKSGIKWGLTCWIRDKPFKRPQPNIIDKINYLFN
jgi:prolyl 4-hydroxylase